MANANAAADMSTRFISLLFSLITNRLSPSLECKGKHFLKLYFIESRNFTKLQKLYQDMIPGLISGAIAGYIAAKLVDGEGKGCFFNLFIGWLGGIFGDWIFGMLGARWHILHPWMGAVLGSVLLLLIFNLISPGRDRRSDTYYSQRPDYRYEDGDDTPDEQ